MQLQYIGQKCVSCPPHGPPRTCLLPNIPSLPYPLSLPSGVDTVQPSSPTLHHVVSLPGSVGTETAADCVEQGRGGSDSMANKQTNPEKQASDKMIQPFANPVHESTMAAATINQPAMVWWP
jgi:hypothetical protein